MSYDVIKLSCQPEGLLITVDKLLPTRIVAAHTKKTPKYKCILASVAELGLVEPLMVYPEPSTAGVFMVLDGNMRLEVVKDLKWAHVPCLVSINDESFTYNHKVNRLAAIQEHFMIAKAVKSGVSQERIAKSLNIDVASIMRKLDILNGVCPEAVELLRDKSITAGALREIRKARPMRQIEIAELMIASHNYTVLYAKCLIAATPNEQLLELDKSKENIGLSEADVARMEREMETVGRDFKAIEESYGKNVLSLVIVVGYLKGLLDNARVVRFLSQNHRELLSEFHKLVESKGLTDGIQEVEPPTGVPTEPF